MSAEIDSILVKWLREPGWLPPVEALAQEIKDARMKACRTRREAGPLLTLSQPFIREAEAAYAEYRERGLITIVQRRSGVPRLTPAGFRYFERRGVKF